MKNYFISGIGTDIGKTIVAAIITEYLEADYWKPVQAGNLDNSDTMLVRELVSNSRTCFHSEAYRLNNPLSPHAAAEMDGVAIDLANIKLPSASNNFFIIEGAGGLLVPLNKHHLVIDLIAHLNAEVILVSKNYLGSINHTLLSAEALKQRGLAVKGIVFNGASNQKSEEAILHFSGLKKLFHVPELKEINKESIRRVADSINWMPE